MAKIRLASFRPGDCFKEYLSAEKLYQIREKSEYEYLRQFRDNLYCPILDCGARLRHHRPKKGQGNAYFSTWPKDDHKPGCSFAFERTPGGGVTIVEDANDPSTVIVINKDRAIRTMQRALNFTQNKKNLNEKKQEGIKPTQATKSDPNINQVITFKEQGENIGKRGPRIRTVDVNELADTQINKLLCVKGAISSMIIRSDYGYINVVNDDMTEIFSVVFSERFRVEFPTEFQMWQRKNLKTLK